MMIQSLTIDEMLDDCQRETTGEEHAQTSHNASHRRMKQRDDEQKPPALRRLLWDQQAGLWSFEGIVEGFCHGECFALC